MTETVKQPDSGDETGDLTVTTSSNDVPRDAPTLQPSTSKLPNEIMSIIYGYCSRGTLHECLFLDHAQFELAVKVLWKNGPAGNLKSPPLKKMLQGPSQSRNVSYRTAMQTFYYDTCYDGTDVKDQLQVLLDHCPNVRTMFFRPGSDSVYGVFYRDLGKGWTEIKVRIPCLMTSRIEGDEMEDWFDPAEWADLSTDLRYTRLAVDSFDHGEDELDSARTVIAQHFNLTHLEIGRELGDAMTINEVIDFAPSSLQQVELYGQSYSVSDVATFISSDMPQLKRFSFCPSSQFFDQLDDDTADELHSAIESVGLDQLVICVDRQDYERGRDAGTVGRLVSFLVRAIPTSCELRITHYYYSPPITENWAAMGFFDTAPHFLWIDTVMQAYHQARQAGSDAGSD